ncbi:MAG: hypothetical protein Ct9H90mP27_1230 [Gammaproteobacteria bacterium]|nr:MAG: hypothetical protein Ct9H90mP27_1230 [Gammaproteobacteria bacterium]
MLRPKVPKPFSKTGGHGQLSNLCSFCFYQDNWRDALASPLCARAIENQTYIFAPAQHGQHSKNRASYGHSVIVDPWGRIVCELPEGDGYAIGEFDQERIDSVRSQFPSLSNRRTFN